MQKIARMLLLLGVVSVSVSVEWRVASQAAPGSPLTPRPSPSQRVVYLAGRLSDEALVSLGSAVAARPGALLLLDRKSVV